MVIMIPTLGKIGSTKDLLKSNQGQDLDPQRRPLKLLRNDGTCSFITRSLKTAQALEILRSAGCLRHWRNELHREDSIPESLVDDGDELKGLKISTECGGARRTS